ncbi:hypothetical protein GF361_00670 [Candidatus Woesearchaeota archaeon]|nr:hypothetical protein [Candidatus Woesearchaeota archaeon]
MKEKLKEIKSLFSVMLFAVGVLILTVSMINVANENIAGRASYNKIKAYGNVYPSLPDGTDISFRVGRVEIASAALQDDKYPVVSFKMDDPTTIPVEGYSPGDTVDVYLAGIKTVEFSYFNSITNKKDINIPASKRKDISTAAAKAAINRSCTPNWNCSDWSECVDGEQTRVCTDLNGCGREEKKPAEKRSCVEAPDIEQPKPMKVDKGLWILALFIVLVIAFIVSITRRAKRFVKKR